MYTNIFKNLFKDNTIVKDWKYLDGIIIVFPKKKNTTACGYKMVKEYIFKAEGQISHKQTKLVNPFKSTHMYLHLHNKNYVLTHPCVYGVYQWI